MKRYGIGLLAIVFLGLGATQAQGEGESFEYATLDRMLSRFVDAEGRVDYAGLKKSIKDLRHCQTRFMEMSPESHPDIFPGRADRLAYWINAYNVFVLKGVVTAYPVGSVREIHAQPGFFKVFQIAGGKSYSLDDIEHKILRAEFADPRIHAAINCGAVSCPRLRQEAFHPDRLDAQLDEAMRGFVQHPHHVKIDRENNIILLSKIFDWFEGDFTGWYKRTQGVAQAHITDYLKLYLSQEDQMFLHTTEVEVRYMSYDWALNDQAVGGETAKSKP